MQSGISGNGASELKAAIWVGSGGSSYEFDSKPVPVGMTLSVDMVYVGTGALSESGHMTEPSLIDPHLEINWKNPDFSGTSVDFWPQYDTMEPEARAAYLKWLVDGRDSKNACISYVLLFYYGLEKAAGGSGRRLEIRGCKRGAG